MVYIQTVPHFAIGQTREYPRGGRGGGEVLRKCSRDSVSSGWVLAYPYLRPHTSTILTGSNPHPDRGGQLHLGLLRAHLATAHRVPPQSAQATQGDRDLAPACE